MESNTPQGPAAQSGATRNRITLSLDLRYIVIVLLLIIGGMLAAWRPWSEAAGTGGSTARTIKVSGEATLKAEPDEFVFYPSYTIRDSDRDAALAAMSKKSDEIIAKLKGLGVADSQIKSNANSYDSGGIYYPAKPTVAPGEPNPGDPGEPLPSYNLQLTITVPTLGMAQKVQNYLNTTAPTGTITPQANFSTAKRKALENQARDEATKDARAKADQSARNLGFKLGSVKSVSDGAGFGGPIPYAASGRELAVDGAAPAAQPAQLSVQPGQNDLSYSVSVEYFVK